MSIVNMQDISRRGFIAGAAVAAAAVAGIGSTALAEETKASEAVPTEWDLEADVVVCGFGAAGIGATVAATEEGLSVVVLEKMDEEHAGGGFAGNGGSLVVNSAEMMKFASYNRWSDEFSQSVIDHMSDAASWITTAHPGMKEIEFLGLPVYMEAAGGIAIYNDISAQLAAQDGVDVEYELAAARLITDPATGEVLGVRAQRDGKELTVKGRLCTVITTGGYAEDKELVGRTTYQNLPYANIGAPAATGDGIILAMTAGARMGDISQSVAFHNPSLRMLSEKIGTGVLMSSPNPGGCIFVNGEGKRFGDESENLIFNHRNVPLLDFYSQGQLAQPDYTSRYKNLPAWAVWDSAMFAAAPIVEQGTQTWARSHCGLDWGTDNTLHGEDEGVLSADTLEELASKMKSVDIWGQEVVVDAQALGATVEAWNASVEAGADAEFGRQTLDAPIATGPFFAIEIEPSIQCTTGGLDTDEASRVLGWDGNPIARLYAAGDISQGVLLTTLGTAGCFGRGHMAVEDAVTLDAWDKQ